MPEFFYLLPTKNPNIYFLKKTSVKYNKPFNNHSADIGIKKLRYSNN